MSSSDTRTLAVAVNQTPQPVAIEVFSAEPERIEKGMSASLRWLVHNATTLSFDGQRAAPVEVRELSPLETTTYVLTAQGLGGPVEGRVTVTVEPLRDGLLPDRGGFRCTIGSAGATGASGLTWLAVLVAAVARRHARRRRRQS